MHAHRVTQKLFKFVPRDTGWEGISWDPVGALGKNGDPINGELETFAPLIRFLKKVYGTQA